MNFSTLINLLLFPYHIYNYYRLVKKSKIRSNELGLICPYHLGDLFNLCDFANYIERKFNTRLVLVISPKYKVIPTFFPEKIRIVNDENLPHPLFAAVIYRIYKKFPFLTNIFPNLTTPQIGKLRIYYLFKEMKQEYFIKKYFDLEKVELKWRPPLKTHSLINKKVLTKFKKYKLKIKKTIILYPITYSAPLLPEIFWERLVKEIKKKGYTVVTNVVGDDKPIKGTIPLFIPLEEQIATAEIAGTIIGVRSGIFDLLAYTKCKKIVLYTRFDQKKPMRFYQIHSLKNRSKKNLYEFIVANPNDTEKLTNKIRKII